jgi:hypothetical protein
MPMTPEQELRKLIFDDLREIKQDIKDVKLEMNTLKIKVALFSSIIGSLAGFFADKFLR